MTTEFSAKTQKPYKKTLPPNDDNSRREYYDQQLRQIDNSIGVVVSSVEQLQNAFSVASDVAIPLVKFSPQTSAPTTPSEGMVYYDSVAHKLKCWDGSAWQSLW